MTLRLVLTQTGTISSQKNMSEPLTPTHMHIDTQLPLLCVKATEVVVDLV